MIRFAVFIMTGVSLLLLPSWFTLAILFAAILFLPLYWEAIIWALFIDLTFSFPSLQFPLALTICVVAVLIISDFVKAHTRFGT